MVEQSQLLEIRGSIPVIGNFIYYQSTELKDEIKENRGQECTNFKSIWVVS